MCPVSSPRAHAQGEPRYIRAAGVRDEKSSLPTILTDLVDRGQHLRVCNRDVATVASPKVQSLAGYPVTASPVANDLHTVVRLRVHRDDHAVEWPALVAGSDPVRPAALAAGVIARSCVPLSSHRPIIASVICQALHPGVDPQFGRLRRVISWAAAAQLSASMVLSVSPRESFLITGLTGTQGARASESGATPEDGSSCTRCAQP